MTLVQAVVYIYSFHLCLSPVQRKHHYTVCSGFMIASTSRQCHDEIVCNGLW